jgi:hypothetical protein
MDHRSSCFVAGLLTRLPGTVAALAAGSVVGGRARTTALALGGGAMAGTVAMWLATPPRPAPAHPRLVAPRTARAASTDDGGLPDVC